MPAGDDLMFNSSESLRTTAQAILKAGIQAVDPARLLPPLIQAEPDRLWIAGEMYSPLPKRIVIVGAGKVSGWMASAAVERFREIQPNLPLEGWINVPDGAEIGADPVTVFPCRPAGHNLPTPRALHGTIAIRERIRDLTPQDVCLVLISGGGSALLVQPVNEISLEDKIAVSQLLAGHSASIQQLNRVRRQLSQVKGGRLIASQPDGRFMSLILSDVLGDPLDLIASGPTVPSPDDTAESAWAVFDELRIPVSQIPDSVCRYLSSRMPSWDRVPVVRGAHHRLVGNLSIAVAAAADQARRLGYSVFTELQSDPHVRANDEGPRLLTWLLERRATSHPVCLISGGEPVVQLSPQPGLGGRNQQLILAAVEALLGRDPPEAGNFCLVSVGTDGEDGTTPVAGAGIDHRWLALWHRLRIDPAPYLCRNDAFSFFNQVGGLIELGPTRTNVGDLRIALLHPANESASLQ